MKNLQALCKANLTTTFSYTLYEEHGVTHLGGPMLGCLANDGAKVWLRTTKPAKVEIQHCFFEPE